MRGVDRRRAAVAGEQGGRAQASPHPAGVEVGHRHQAQGAVAEQVGLHAAEAEHHHGTEQTVVDDAAHQLDGGR